MQIIEVEYNTTRPKRISEWPVPDMHVTGSSRRCYGAVSTHQRAPADRHTRRGTTGLALFAECRIHSAKALGKGFAECGTRQTALGKKSDGECTFAECFFSGTRQSLCRVSKSTRQIFRNQIRKTVFKNSKIFYFHPVITPIIQCHKSQVSLLFRVKSRATRLP